jgi:hypothetical protein
VILAVLLVVATVPQSSLVAIAAQQVTTIMPHDLQPVPNPQLPTAERRAQLHKALASSGDPYDVILEIGRIGDATSVSFLIEALAKQGTVPREGQYAAIDTRFHVLDALQSITNHDAGRNAEDWRPWYEKNKGKTQAQRIKDGFVEHGFPADLPNELGAYNGLEQDGENVFVLAQGRALAFNVATGSRLWATDEFTSFAFFKTFGRAAVTRNGHFDLEWRDVSSGEVIAKWGKRDGGFASNVVMAGGNVLVEISQNGHRGDGLRLLGVPDALKQ